MSVRAVDDKASDTLVVVSGEGSWTGSSTLPHLHHEDGRVLMPCTHVDQIQDVRPSAHGCEDCLRIGGWWVHLRMCLVCGHAGCCDESPNRHATAHFHE